jgi:DNA-binding PadR family transcriptional regulator
MSETLGGFEKLLLLAVLRLGREAYGAAIFEELEERTARGVAPGAVYVTLRRLEKRGLVRARVGESTPERGGRAKKIYALEPSGLAALRDARREWDAMAEGLETILEAES